MPTEYFEQRERALLGERFDALYAAPQETAERGVTVSVLRTTPEQFAAKADFSLEASPFCKAAFVVHQPDFKPGPHTQQRRCRGRRRLLRVEHARVVVRVASGFELRRMHHKGRFAERRHFQREVRFLRKLLRHRAQG